MLVLLKILPFLFSAVEGDQFVKLILELIEIVQIIFARYHALHSVKFESTY